MGKKRTASAYIFGAKYKNLVDIGIPEDLAEFPLSAYDISPTVEENGLHPREVYNRILDGVFSVAHPEKTKTSRATVAEC